MEFSFHRWYPQLASLTIDSQLIPLSSQFIEYLESDGIFDCADTFTRPIDSDYDDEEDANISDCSKGRDSDISTVQPDPNVLDEIIKAIDQLGGSVFPKLNWSSPRDACWIMTSGTPECRAVSDILLLLKSSDFITHDLERYRSLRATAEAAPVVECCNASDISSGDLDLMYLVLRRWISDLRPSMEFRCFVRRNRLVAISQRQTENFYDFLPAIKVSVGAAIDRFWRQKLSHVLLAHTDIRDNYVFDVHVADDCSKRILLIDLNPFDRNITDSLLFDWDELDVGNGAKEEFYEFRTIESEFEASKSNAPRFTTSRLPIEATAMSQGVTLAEFAQTLDKSILESMTK